MGGNALAAKVKNSTEGSAAAAGSAEGASSPAAATDKEKPKKPFFRVDFL